jgi:hypothetical protein
MEPAVYTAFQRAYALNLASLPAAGGVTKSWQLR